MRMHRTGSRNLDAGQAHCPSLPVDRIDGERDVGDFRHAVRVRGRGGRDVVDGQSHDARVAVDGDYVRHARQVGHFACGVGVAGRGGSEVGDRQAHRAGVAVDAGHGEGQVSDVGHDVRMHGAGSRDVRAIEHGHAGLAVDGNHVGDRRQIRNLGGNVCVDGRSRRNVGAGEQHGAGLPVHDVDRIGQVGDVAHQMRVAGRGGGEVRQIEDDRAGLAVDALHRDVWANERVDARSRRDRDVRAGRDLKGREGRVGKGAADSHHDLVAAGDARRDAGRADYRDVDAHGFTTVTEPERTVRVNSAGSTHRMYQR